MSMIEVRSFLSIKIRCKGYESFRKKGLTFS